MDCLDAVAVMDVEIDVQHAHPRPTRKSDRQRGVVVDAEAGRAVRHGVVQAATRMEPVLDVAAQDGLHCSQASAGDGCGGLVHTRERRVIAELADSRLRLAERVA